MDPNDSAGDQRFPGSPNNPPTHPHPLPGQQSPQYAPPQQQQKRLRSGEGVSCGVAAVLLILMVSVVGVAVYIGVHKAGDALRTTFSAAQAAKQVGFFCTYVETQNYSMAYRQLSTMKQGSVSESDFAAHAAALDESDGWVVTCAIAADHPDPTISGDGKSATARIQVARSDNAKIVNGAMKLVFEDGEWKIESADSSLKLV